MKLHDYLFILALFGLLFFFIRTSQNDDQQSTDITPLQHQIDSLKGVISGRDSLIIQRDSVIRVTTRTKEIIREYHNTTDTITKLILCDSLAIACDSMADQYQRQDSIFRLQITDLKQVISKQDTVIQGQTLKLKKAQRTNHILIGACAVLSVVAILK